MAIIYSYPGIGTVSTSDVLPICDMSEEGFPTRSITMSQIASFVKGASGVYGVNKVTTSTSAVILTSTGATQGTGDVTVDLELRENETWVGKPDGSKVPISSGSIDSTGAILLPRGTAAERPSPAKAGMIRYNTDTCVLEVYLAEDTGGCGGTDDWYPINVA